MNQTDQMNQTNQTNGLRWYAIRTRSRHAKVVRDQFVNQGIEPLLPTVKRMSQWKDRKKEIEVPLFRVLLCPLLHRSKSCRCSRP